MTAEPRLDNMRVVRAPRGPEITAKSWLTEAPMRMLMNNLDPDVAERPGELVVYGGIGRAARDWNAFDKIVETLKRLEADETLLIQSGKPVGVFKTHADAPRVLIANSNLVPHWATWDHFNELDRKGLMMYGQMTAGSWIYIGTQGIVQGTYETFVEMGRRALRRLAERQVDLDRGPGRHGRRAAACGDDGGRFAAGDRMPSFEPRVPLAHPVPRRRGEKPRRSAVRSSSARPRKAKPISVGLLGNAAEVLPELVRRGVKPDIVTDQTSRARSSQRLFAQGLDAAAMGGAARQRSRRRLRAPRKNRWRSTCARCWRIATPASPPSTTATTSARWRSKKG